jgi:hypothetical protein
MTNDERPTTTVRRSSLVVRRHFCRTKERQGENPAMSEDFYEQLAVQQNFLEIANPAVYCPVPADWFLVLTDVKGSTEAIRAGRYKEVNLIGAASIIALLNVAHGRDIPFVFGGDGATLLIPPSLLAPAQAALAGTQQIAASEFALDLRVGIVAVRKLLAAGHEIRLARVRISDHYDQAMLTGSGLTYFERLVKDPATAAAYQLDPNISPQADFTGLECRWEDVQSRYGETVTLLVVATGVTAVAESDTYRSTLQQIDLIYGRDGAYSPVTPDTLNPTMKPAILLGETKFRSPAQFWQRQKYLWQIWTVTTTFKALLKGTSRRANKPWNRYLDLLVDTTDYRKYDNVLRMVIAGAAEQRQALVAYLEEGCQRGELVYGLHVSDRALLTCVVFERMGRQVHFVDGADGGYALAAVDLKNRSLSRPAGLPG